MSQCSNCKQNLSCGCQRRNASDGTQVCTNCITNYESKKIVSNNSVIIDNTSDENIHPRAQRLRKFIR